MNQSIVVRDLSKRYRRYATRSLRATVAELPQRLFAKRSPYSDERWLWAVRDLSFEAAPGESLGIIGANGAGKTTTLKLLTGITRPTSGIIQLAGRVSSLIELAAGFHPELTGKENTFLYGTILGLKRSEIASRFDEIVEFSGLAEFMDTPVKYYSSGMYARLGFSIAAHTNPQVFLVDEVLAVGDYSFQQRCYERMRHLHRRGTTTILVTHNLAAVAEFCDRAIVLSQGHAVFTGSVDAALVAYAKEIRKPIASRNEIAIGRDGIGERLMTHGARINAVEIVDSTGSQVGTVNSGDRIRVRASIEFFENSHHPQFACFVRDVDGRLVYDQTTGWSGTDTPIYSRGERETVECELQMNVVQGIYSIGFDVHYFDLSCYYDRIESAASVVVTGGDGAKGISDLRCRFHLNGRRPRLTA